MKPLKHLTAAFGLVLALTSAAHADPVELNQEQLRHAARTGDIIGLRDVMTIVETAFTGRPIDVRAFSADGVYYRVLIKKQTGNIVCLLLDAHNGDVVPLRTGIGHEIETLARAVRTTAQG